MSTKINLLIVDDHQIMIDGIQALLSGVPNFQVLAATTSAFKALELLKELDIDIVLTDINMPEMSGIELTQKIHDEFPGMKVLALSMFGEKQTIREMIDAGVQGYILKNTGKEELLNALNKIASGGLFFGDEITAELMRNYATETTKVDGSKEINLTKRELEIVALIAKEYNNSQIAEALFISERTVETHRKNIFRKTKTKSLVGLIKFAYEHKIIE